MASSTVTTGLNSLGNRRRRLCVLAQNQYAGLVHHCYDETERIANIELRWATRQ